MNDREEKTVVYLDQVCEIVRKAGAELGEPAVANYIVEKLRAPVDAARCKQKN